MSLDRISIGNCTSFDVPSEQLEDLGKCRIQGFVGNHFLHFAKIKLDCYLPPIADGNFKINRRSPKQIILTEVNKYLLKEGYFLANAKFLELPWPFSHRLSGDLYVKKKDLTN